MSATSDVFSLALATAAAHFGDGSQLRKSTYNSIRYPKNMKIKIRHLLALTIASVLVAPPVYAADDFAGNYREIKTGKIVTVKKVDTDKYSITTDDWEGVGFWDKKAKAYEGTYRYKSSATANLSEALKSGTTENMVGYHLIEPTKDGGLKVTYQGGLSTDSGRGTYEMQRTK